MGRRLARGSTIVLSAAATALLGTGAAGATADPPPAAATSRSPAEPMVADVEPPRITFTPNPQTPPPGASGWYRDLSPFGTLPFVVDFMDPAGLETVACAGLVDFAIGPPTLLGTTYGHSAGVNADGVHALDCTATDDLGNTGVGPGSTAMPVVVRIDRTPPVIECPASARFRRHPRPGTLVARVVDTTSGPVSATVEVDIDRSRVGTFTVPVAAADVAGNTASTTCTYHVCHPRRYRDGGRRHAARW